MPNDAAQINISVSVSGPMRLKSIYSRQISLAPLEVAPPPPPRDVDFSRYIPAAARGRKRDLYTSPKRVSGGSNSISRAQSALPVNIVRSCFRGDIRLKSLKCRFRSGVQSRSGVCPREGRDGAALGMRVDTTVWIRICIVFLVRLCHWGNCFQVLYGICDII